MKTEVLVSTMNIKNQEDFEEKINKMNIKGKSLTINQITKKDIETTTILKQKNRILSYYEKGLSKSRNRAIENSNEEIILISDDDMIYSSEYEKTIIKAYEKYKDADIIAFVVENENRDRAKKILNKTKIRYLMSMKLQSVQLTMKSKSIADNKMKFDEDFGAGSMFFMGEENIFLFDCLRKKMKIYYVPEKIAILKDGKSSWFDGYNERYFRSRGASFYRMSKVLFLPLILQFAIRKRKLYNKEMGMIKTLLEMYKGKNEYIKYKRTKEKMEVQ